MSANYRTSALVLAALFLLMFSTITHAALLYVPDDYETIQEGIDHAEDGDTVLVQPGEYLEYPYS